LSIFPSDNPARRPESSTPTATGVGGELKRAVRERDPHELDTPRRIE
jgi:hypothetical protein